jgi:hypothetical protein
MPCECVRSDGLEKPGVSHVLHQEPSAQH